MPDIRNFKTGNFNNELYLRNFGVFNDHAKSSFFWTSNWFWPTLTANMIKWGSCEHNLFNREQNLKSPGFCRVYEILLNDLSPNIFAIRDLVMVSDCNQNFRWLEFFLSSCSIDQVLSVKYYPAGRSSLMTFRLIFYLMAVEPSLLNQVCWTQIQITDCQLKEIEFKIANPLKNFEIMLWKIEIFVIVFFLFSLSLSLLRVSQKSFSKENHRIEREIAFFYQFQST